MSKYVCICKFLAYAAMRLRTDKINKLVQSQFTSQLSKLIELSASTHYPTSTANTATMQRCNCANQVIEAFPANTITNSHNNGNPTNNAIVITEFIEANPVRDVIKSVGTMSLIVPKLAPTVADTSYCSTSLLQFR